MVNSQKLLSKYKNSIKDDYSIVTTSVGGISANTFFDLVIITGIDKNQLAENIFEISLKTINRYKQENKKLNPRNSELILKLLALYNKGIEVFGKLESFNNWLMKPAFGIGNKTPFSLMNTSTGIDLIFEELIRIEYGDLA
jgi:putative toxin-antitoxin system antitoxin component (TIGR02293 family)